MVSFLYHKSAVILPSPELGDTDVFPLNTIVDRAMDGRFYTFNGASIHEYRLTFRHVNRPKILEVINFLNLIPSNIFKYVDWNGASYNVRYLEDTFVETHQGIHDNIFTMHLEIVN